jgi:hypothetical protein
MEEWNSGMMGMQNKDRRKVFFVFLNQYNTIPIFHHSN